MLKKTFAKPPKKKLFKKTCLRLLKHTQSHGKERKGKERKGKERKGKERKGKERKGKERKGKERKGSVVKYGGMV